VRLIALALSLAAACASGGLPRLEVGEQAAPERSGADVVTARFRLHNAGSGDLIVHAVVPDCACRTGFAGGEAVGPGRDAELAAACRLLPGTAAERHIRVRSNDPAHPETVLEVAMPSSPAATEPAALFFGQVPVGQSAAREIVVRAGGATDVPTVSGESLTVVRGGERPDGTPTHRVTFAPTKAGIVRGSLVTRAGAAPVPIVGVGVGRVAAFPAEVHWPSAVAEGVPTVMLKNLGEAPLAIAGVDLPSGLGADVRPVEAGRQYRLVLRRAGGAPVAETGAIRVRTDSPDEPVLVIPVVRERDPAAAG
jgi:hypothetical protein